MKESKAEKNDKDGWEAGRGRNFACSDDQHAGVRLGSPGAAPSVGGVCELTDDGAAQMGSSLAPSSLLCMDSAL